MKFTACGADGQCSLCNHSLFLVFHTTPLTFPCFLRRDFSCIFFLLKYTSLLSDACLAYSLVRSGALLRFKLLFNRRSAILQSGIVQSRRVTPQTGAPSTVTACCRYASHRLSSPLLPISKSPHHPPFCYFPLSVAQRIYMTSHPPIRYSTVSTCHTSHLRPEQSYRVLYLRLASSHQPLTPYF